MGINRLKGTPWHKERVHRDENDERRYKGRCRYFEYEGEHCTKNFCRCSGCSHCAYYEAISEEEFHRRQRQEQERKRIGPSSGDDDCYWYD